MKKSNLLAILLIFILPVAMYYILKSPVCGESGRAIAETGRAKVLEFSSPMCYDCKRIEKEIAPLRAEQQYKSIISFQKINVSDRTPAVEQLIKTYNVDVVPTLVFIDKNGKEQCKIQGYTPQNKLRECLNRIK